MQAQPPDTPSSPDPAAVAAEPLRKKLSRRAQIIGAVVALAATGGVGWLAWSLTHQDKSASAQAGAGSTGAGAGGAGAGGPGGAAAGGRRGAATTVGVAVAERTDIPIVIDALGTVVPQASVRVRPQVGGVLTQVLFKEGQMVRKGELLATIDPRQFEMALQQASGQRMRDEAQLQAAQVTLERYRTLLQQDSIARQDADTQAALVKQLEGTIVVDKANEGTARLNLGYTRIVAPIAGRVGLRTVDVGNVVGTSDANGVALITAISPIDVEFAVPQDVAPVLQQNAGAVMEAKAFDRTRQTVLETGVFASMDNQVDTQTGTVRAKARFNNAKLALFPSQFVNLQLNVRVIKDAVVIPVSALRHGGTGDYVFVLKDDRSVSQRPVTRGQATVDKVQIATGLQVGERVITEGADRLRDGSRVILPGDGPGAGRGQGQGAGRRRADGASAPAGDSSGASGGGAQSGASGGDQERSPRRAAPAASGTGDVTPQNGPAQARSQSQAQAQSQFQSQSQSQSRAPAAATPGAPLSDKPTAEQRQRLLDSAKDNPEQLDRRKKFLDALDKGDAQAVERWHQMQQRRREGGGGSQ